jgi:hypothetical protein
VNKVTGASGFPLGGDELAWLGITETQDMHYLAEKIPGAFTAARFSIVAGNQRGTSQARALRMSLARRESIE